MGIQKFLYNKIYHMDAMEFMSQLPDDFVDLVITSPQYNLMGQYSSKSQMKQRCGNTSSGFTSSRLENWYDDSMPEDEYQKLQRKYLKEMVRVCRGNIFYVHQVRYAWGRKNEWYHPVHWLDGFVVWAEIIWDRGNGISAAKRPTMSDQRIYMINKPKTWNGPNCTSVWRIPPVKNSKHPCPFPEELVKRCISMCSNENDVIFDPFIGSGTTAIVAKKMNRRFLGCDINKDYVDWINEEL